MAFYHVNSCDCPIGCCDCGEPRDQNIHVAYNPKKDKIYAFDEACSARHPKHVAEEYQGNIYLGQLEPNTKEQS